MAQEKQVRTVKKVFTIFKKRKQNWLGWIRNSDLRLHGSDLKEIFTDPQQSGRLIPSYGHSAFIREKILLSLVVGSVNCSYTVIRFVSVSAKFGTCTVVSVIGTLLKGKKRRFKGECDQFSFDKCPIYTHDGASAKFSTNSHEKDYSV
jgi:hypothetical protein